ncbi:pantetheine-phosphate adenylyltransferase family protein [Colletotrichum truncatum]|uniref:Pantetheine-phosphate adenylyltransferase family protein n=1 Tax=Colletotrichum truncatum TaxID=5467 RepID=A0ACC3YCT1_COLTU|nr:pantetheine-phosphate adenylyltransferase family protein [Colletotrichum truncatum]KAF6783501.1 pantetheine-phosphate adenylyltransferase family protein [Colletotrichum truncatum]
MSSESHPSLLLLPFPPRPPSRTSLSAAYRPSLLAVLSKIKNPARSSVLVVAIVCPILRGASPKTKSLSWTAAQSLAAGIYSLIAVVCAEQSIATDVNGGPGSVDARVVLVDHDANRRFAPDFVAAIEPNNTTVVDLPTFASAYHPWSYIFHVNSEQGYRTLSTYLKFAEGKQTILQSQLVVVEAGLSMNLEGPGTDNTDPTPGYPVVCLGGTFDHLHPGHKLMLMAAVLLLRVPEKDSGSSCRLVLGIAGDQLLKNKKYAELVQSWDDRVKYTLDFLATLLELDKSGWKKKSGPVSTVMTKPGHLEARFRNGTIVVECVEFQDVYGPTTSMPEIEALVVSGETRSGGKAVNDKRISQGWKALETYEVDVLDAHDLGDEAARTDDFANKISSTAIRQQKAESAAKSSL